MSDPDEAARDFLRSVFEFIAHGDADHRRWLLAELRRWERPLARLLDDAIKQGIERGKWIAVHGDGSTLEPNK